MNSSNNVLPQPASLLRRLGAILYDFLLLISCLLMAGLLAYPITKGQASIGYHLYIYAICFFYFAYPWKKTGQTVGMLAWRIQLQSNTSQTCTWSQLLIRFMVALVSWSLLGLGFWRMLFDKEQRTWHDLASRTKLVYLPKSKA